MNKKAFIFTMDAALALIPIFIIMASVSQISIGGSLLLQSQVLGTERIAHDTLRVMGIKELGLNATALEDFLNSSIPSYLNYNYTVENITGDIILSLTRGDISNATDIVQVSRVVISVGVEPSYAVLTPTALTKTFINAPTADPRLDNQSMALDAVISALLETPVNTTDMIGANIWYEMSQVRVNISALEDWHNANQTVGYLLDRLYDEAVLEGNSDAQSGFNTIRSRVNSAGQWSLTYTLKPDILNYDNTIPSVTDMEISGLDVLYAASQSANKDDLGLSTITVYNSTDDGRLVITLDITGNETTQIVVGERGRQLCSERTTAIEIEVWRNESSWVPKETIRAFINPEPCFNVTSIRLDPADLSIVLVDIESIDSIGRFRIWAGSSMIDTNQIADTLYPNNFQGDTMAETGVIFRSNDSMQPSIDFYTDYKNAMTNAGSELSQILSEFPITRLEYNATVLVEREGYVTVSSIMYEVPQYVVTLKLWGS